MDQLLRVTLFNQTILLPAGKTEWLTIQCEKRECMRQWLEESKSQLQKLRKKVEHLQEELTLKKHLLNPSVLFEPSVIAVSSLIELTGFQLVSSSEPAINEFFLPEG